MPRNENSYLTYSWISLCWICIALVSFSSSFCSAQEFKIVPQRATFIHNAHPLELGDIGGMTSPIISKADVDFDNIEDLFIYDRHGSASYWLKGQGNQQYSQPENHDINWPDTYFWTRLVDFNNDGIPDALGSSEDPFKDEIQAYLGHKSGSTLVFEPVINSEGKTHLTYSD